MQGFPNRLAINQSLENVTFLYPPTPLETTPQDSPVQSVTHTATTPESASRRSYVCTTPPKPIHLHLADPKSASASPSRSPFARYSRRQNNSLLSVQCDMSCLSLSPSPFVSSPAPRESPAVRTPKEEKSGTSPMDEFGFFIEETQHLFQMDNGSANTSETDLIHQWREIIDADKSLEDVPLELLQKGIPQSLRREVWKYLALAHEQKNPSNVENKSLSHYLQNIDGDAVAQFEAHLACGMQDDNSNLNQIELDLSRTFPTHQMFHKPDCDGIASLRRVLVAYSHRNSHIGYCQGMSYIAAMFLMLMDEVECFWLFDWLMQRLGGNYTPCMSGIIEDSNVFDELLHCHYPLIFRRLKKCGLHPLMYTTSWYMTLFTQLTSWRATLQFFDLLFFYEPRPAMFRFSLGLMHVCQADILAITRMDVLLPYLQCIPVARCNSSLLIPLACSYPIDIFVKDVRTRLAQADAQAEARTPVATPKQTKPAPQPSSTKTPSFFDKVFGFNTPKPQAPLKKSTQRRPTPGTGLKPREPTKVMTPATEQSQSKKRRRDSYIPTQVPFPEHLLRSPKKMKLDSSTLSDKENQQQRV